MTQSDLISCTSTVKRLKWQRDIGWTLVGLLWIGLVVMVLLWSIEHSTAIRLRGKLVNEIELRSGGVE